jgi:hypothetical protein
MKRAWCAGVIAASLSAVLGAAQQPATGAHASPQQPGAAASAGTATITGCVERADQLMTGGANTLATSIDSLDFVLIRAKVSGSEPSAPVGTAGSGGVPGAAGTSARPDDRIGEMFRLDGETAMLNPHVGHQVEVVGTRSGANPAPDAGVSPSAPTLATAPTVRVESVKMIAETCPK